MKKLSYIVIIILFLVIFFQNRSCQPPEPITKMDTIYVYKHIRDTIRIDSPVYISGRIDTIWLDKNPPDTTYEGLLNQYTLLGNQHFKYNVFKSTFPVSDYGTVSVTDTIYGNWLMSSNFETDLKIPTTTITVEKETPPKNEFYTGGSITLDKYNPFSGIYGGIIYKDKKDKLYGINIGYNGNIQYGLSYYTKIKLKR